MKEKDLQEAIELPKGTKSRNLRNGRMINLQGKKFINN